MSVGHRYWCLSVLASYGIKCDIPEDEVLTDALELLPMLDHISDDDHNRFTKRDVLDAMNMYQENYVTYSRTEVERVSGISVPPNKRNGLKQKDHLEIARAIQTIKDRQQGKNWREGMVDQRGAVSRKNLLKNGELHTQREEEPTVSERQD